MDIDDLLDAPELGLVERTNPDAVRVPISWVATTELQDVADFLRGRELVLTTLLADRDEAELIAFVESLVGVGAAALCVGVGHVRTEIPCAVVETADRLGLPLLQSSPDVPFVQISQWVADRLYADQYRLVREHARDQDELLSALGGPDPVGNVVATLRRVLGSPVVLRDVAGHVIEARPRGARETPVSIPVRVRGTVVARLESVTDEKPAVRELAASLLGLELARRSAVLEGRGELVGQLLDDVRWRRGDDPTLLKRLLAADLNPRGVHLVCAVVDRESVASAVLNDVFGDPRTTIPAVAFGDAIWLVTPDAAAADAHAHDLQRRLRAHGTGGGIGLAEVVLDGGSLDGLRAALARARDLAELGPGIHAEGPSPITSLAQHSSSVALVAERTLAPLREHDRAQNADLVRTLAVYLTAGGSPTAACDELVIHRNTLRYRLGLVRDLTGLEPADLQDRVELWLAMAAAGEVTPRRG